MRIQWLLYFLTIFVLISCSNDKSPTSKLEDSVCVNFQADMMIIQEEYRVLREDSTTLQYKIDSLYHHYNITESQVETAVQDYKKDLTRWKEFNTKIMKRLEVLQQEELVGHRM